MIPSVEEIIWLAGWLEGEGCFYVGLHPTKQSGKTYVYISYQIKASSTDKDVVEHVARLLGSNVTGPYQNKAHHTPYYKAQLSRRDDVIVWCRRLLPYMGKRRSERIKEMITTYEEDIK